MGLIRRLASLAAYEFPPLPYCAKCACYHVGPPCT